MKYSLPLQSILALMLAGMPWLADAGTPAQYKALQDWCVAYNHNNANPQNRVVAPQQPPNSPDYHHYCYSLRSLSKLYTARTQSDIQLHMGELIDNANYVIRRVPSTDPYLPEVYVLLAKAHMNTNKLTQASTYVSQALALDPQHGEAYGIQADLYLAAKRNDKAEEAVRSGLTFAPTSKKLHRLARQLGMKVEPPPKATGAEEASAKDAAPVVAGENNPAPKKRKKPGYEPTEVEIGNQKNPWCRFCTDIPAEPPATSPSTPGVIPKAD